MAQQVFISYAIEDKPIADAVCKALEQGGVQCWYAPRDVPYAVDYEEAIVDAISASKLMLLVLSSHSNDSKHVKREVQNASREEPQVPVLPFQIEDVTLNKSLRYYIGSVHWLSALAPPLEDHLERLVGYVQQRLPQGVSSPAAAVGTTEQRVETASVKEENANLAAVRNSRGEGEVTLKPTLPPRAEGAGHRAASVLFSARSVVDKQEWWMRFVEIGSLCVLLACVLTWFRILPLSPYFVSRAIVPVFIGLLTIALVAIVIKIKVTGEARRPKLFFIIAGVTVLSVYAFILSGSWGLAWRSHHITLLIFISTFIFAVITFVRSTSVPPPTWRAMALGIIAALVVPAAYGLARETVAPVTSVKLMLVIGLAFLVFAVIAFARKTHAPPTIKLVASLSVVTCAAILVGLRLDREELEFSEIQAQTSEANASSTPTPPGFTPLRTAKDNDARGSELFRQQKYAEAEPYYREAVRLEPGNAVYNNNLGDALFQQKKYPQAEPYYSEAVRLAPDSALMHNNLGLSLEFQRKYIQAESEYRAAVRLEPSNAGYNNNLGDALYKQQKYLQAEPYYREAVRLDPDNAYKRNNLGLSLEFQRKYLEAESEYREAVRLEPSNASYNNNLGDVLYKQQKYAQAEPYYREAVRLDPNNSVYQENLKKIKGVTTSD